MWYISRRINKLFKKKREKLFEAFHFDILNSQQPFKILNILDKNVKSWDSGKAWNNTDIYYGIPEYPELRVALQFRGHELKKWL